MERLQRPSRSPQVRLLQRLLNQRVAPVPLLQEDSIFGSKTERILERFQRQTRLTVNGIADHGEWRALGVSVDISHRIDLYPQPTNMTCWSAAATMVTGSRMSMGPGSAAVGVNGGLLPQFNNVRSFAESHGLQFNAPQSWTTNGLISLIQRGPLWVAGWIPSGHAVAYGGIHGTGDADETIIIVYDPWPPGVGEIRSEIYGDWMRKYPTATTYILETL